MVSLNLVGWNVRKINTRGQYWNIWNMHFWFLSGCSPQTVEAPKFNLTIQIHSWLLHNPIVAWEMGSTFLMRKHSLVKTALTTGPFHAQHWNYTSINLYYQVFFQGLSPVELPAALEGWINPPSCIIHEFLFFPRNECCLFEVLCGIITQWLGEL